VKIDTNDTILVHDLFRSFKVVRPLKRSIAPKWNRVLVFDALTREPFEPNLHKADILHLSMKTLFLTLMATSSRRNEVFYFEASQVSYSRDYGEISLGVLTEFVTKRSPSIIRW
jgi:hypothetical protein